MVVRLWLAALAAVARCDEFGWDDLDLVDVDEDGGPAITHDDVMRAAESKERYVHSFAFEGKVASILPQLHWLEIDT
jgi:hypothetical protein